MLRIAKNDLRIVRGILSQQILDCEVRAFGSRVHGRNFKTTSDLDLVIMSQRPLSGARLAQLKESFSESDLPIKVDVVDWADCSSAFKNIISQQSVLIQSKAPVKESRQAA